MVRCRKCDKQSYNNTAERACPYGDKMPHYETAFWLLKTVLKDCKVGIELIAEGSEFNCYIAEGKSCSPFRTL